MKNNCVCVVIGSPANYDKLSANQRDIIDCMLDGKSQVEIAKELGIDITTVRDRLKSARRKLKWEIMMVSTNL